jgi:hypothetical protein
MSRAQTRRGWQAHFRGELPRPWGAKADRAIQRSEGRTSPPHIVQSEAPGAVRVHIEELVLRGLEHADGDRIVTAIRSELIGILTAKGLPPNWRHSRSFEASATAPARVTSRANARWIGAHIAQALYSVREERRK